MNLHLVDTDGSVVAALARAFDPHPEVSVRQADIFDVAFDTIVSPANSHGFMDGGIDRRYVEVLGSRAQEAVLSAIEGLPGGVLPVGSALVVPVRHPRIAWLLVAPTMPHPEAVEPRNAFRAMAAILRRAGDGRRRPVLPGAGHGDRARGARRGGGRDGAGLRALARGVKQ